MTHKFYRKTPGAVSSPINIVDVEGTWADWIQAVAGGQIVFTDGSGTVVTDSFGAGDVIPGPIHAITSSAGAIRYGTGPMPIPGPTAASAGSATNAATSETNAAASATAAASSATAAASSATAAASSATTAATQATNAAASAVTAAGYGLAPSATVITADPAPAVIGTLYVCNPSGGAFNVALPAIGSGNHGKRIGFTVSTTSANAVTPVPNGTDILPGGFTSVSGAYGFATLEADNTPSPKVWRRVG